MFVEKAKNEEAGFGTSSQFVSMSGESCTDGSISIKHIFTRALYCQHKSRPAVKMYEIALLCVCLAAQSCPTLPPFGQ